MDEAELRLGEFEAKWDDDYLPTGQSWRCNWARITPFLDVPTEMRKVIYTTNAIESVNMHLRNGRMPIRDWKAALMCFTINYENRLPQQ